MRHCHRKQKGFVIVCSEYRTTHTFDTYARAVEALNAIKVFGACRLEHHIEYIEPAVPA